MDELTREFLIESQEGLDRMERCLTDLEERPQDTELLSEIFRSVHTIKGTTGFLGFKRLEKLAHAGENLLGLLRDGKLSANEAIITGLLQLMDALRGILRIIESHNHEGEAADAQGDAALIARLNELQHPVKATITVAAVTEAAAPPGEVPTQLAPPAAHPSAPAIPDPETAPAPAARAAAISDASKPAADDGKPKVAAAADSTLRVDVALLNRMMNLVGELVLTRNQILQATAANPNFTLLSRRLDMVTADLRESVMKARMQPVSNVFSKFPRIIRDLSQMLHRRVRLVLEGQETELDKSLLEAIKDPLTHAVRNSLDHGIEMPDVRAAAGKDPEGTLKLRAYQESSHVIIEVSDDGAGIGVERVRNKAIERGLITPERAAQLGERELLQLIFLPGFSTAEAVTNVSGRGVGMDVVRTNVEKIGGKVEIESRPGKGTTLRLRIPLTLAIIPALIVRSLDQSFALPQGALSELVHIPPDRVASAIEWMQGTPLYRLRGQLLPLVFLDRLLSRQGRLPASGLNGHPPASAALPGRDHFIAVLDADGRRFGLVVDGLADPEEIVVKPLSTILKSIGLYSGATVLGSGDLALILDPGSMATRAGVALAAAKESTEVSRAEEDAGSMGSRYLLVEAGQRRAAVPLGDVLRIERIPFSRIEYIGYRPVLNFEGQLLPIEDSAGIFASVAGEPDAQIIVVVCREGNRQVGIAVSHVLDVAAGNELFEAGSQHRASGVTLLNDHVTGIVDLGAIQALPMDSLGGGYSSDWSQVSETTTGSIA
ncbi:MAG TPA: chemotaxis protein CheW [Acidobacteriaceae bacterium]|jgi:two-component system chemotaxis sensor kinase CheA|nr:chemotaxis protein CheW [Acidobacteriaceae bacterium]